MSDEITPGEMMRSLKRLEDSQLVQTRKLDEIKDQQLEIVKQTTETNGRVGNLEDRVSRNEHKLHRLDAAVFRRRSTDATVASEKGEGFSFKASPKVWTALAAAIGLLLSQLFETFKHWLAQGK